MSKFLDKSGLARFWQHVKSYIDGKEAVMSFNGRGGAVVPQSGDYNATQTAFNPNTTELQANNVQGAIEELFTSVSNGKELVASAITGNGVDTEKDATFQQMADNINKIRADIYGVTWDGSENTRLTRTDAARKFIDPTPAVGESAGYSPFDDIMPWSGMKRVVQDGNELIAIPKYYVKVQHFPFRVQISEKPFNGSQVSPAHRDREDGVGERDVVYIGRYECDESYMSRSGQTPKVLTTLTSFRSGISALGDEYWQADFALQLTWWFLYIVEFADWDGQKAIGLGIVDASEVHKTGETDTMVYHTGRAAGIDGQTAVQYRGIENPFGNIREWRDGIILSDENICTYNNPANFSSKYNDTGSVIRSNKRATESGYITEWGYDESDQSFIYPSAVGGSNEKFIPDYCYYNTGIRAPYVGGNWSNGKNAGPFCISGSGAPTNASESTSSRIQKLPRKI